MPCKNIPLINVLVTQKMTQSGCSNTGFQVPKVNMPVGREE